MVMAHTKSVLRYLEGALNYGLLHRRKRNSQLVGNGFDFGFDFKGKQKIKVRNGIGIRG